MKGLNIIYTAIDELSAQSDDDVQVEKSETTLLFGGDGIDSLALVNLVVAIETRVQDIIGKPVVLVDEKTMAMEENPFQTIGTLAAYLDGLIATN